MITAGQRLSTENILPATNTKVNCFAGMQSLTIPDQISLSLIFQSELLLDLGQKARFLF